MSKAVLISIRPKWCELIADGKKTVEIRKTRPKIETPFKCYIYCTRAQYTHEDFLVVNAGTEKAFAYYAGGTIIGEFTCDEIQWNGGSSLIVKEDREAATRGSCVSREELFRYLGIVPGTSVFDKKSEFYCWHISSLLIYDEPKNLNEFMRKPCGFAASCGACEHAIRAECNGIADFPVDCEFAVHRPPQSWCYVEDE